MRRILEPEVMDTAEEACSYDAMDHSVVNRLFVTDLLETNPNLDATLDLGTGTGLVVVELGNRSDAARITAIDLSAHMLERARQNIEAAGLASRVHLECVDAKQLPYDEGQFSTVVSNSIIHHIPEPLGALAEAVRVTVSGGRLFCRDLLRPESTEEVEKLVATYAGDEPDHAKRLFRESLHAALSLEEIRDMVASLGFARESVVATSDRHWTWSSPKQ